MMEKLRHKDAADVWRRVGDRLQQAAARSGIRIEFPDAEKFPDQVNGLRGDGRTDNHLIVHPSAELEKTRTEYSAGQSALVVCEGARLRNCIFRFKRKGGVILIGPDVEMSDCVVQVEGPSVTIAVGRGTRWLGGGANVAEPSMDLVIGERCDLDSDCAFQTSDSHPFFDIVTGKRMNGGGSIYVEDHVWLGAGCRIGKGVRIGSNGIVRTASILTRSTEAGALYAGAPARLVARNVVWRRRRWGGSSGLSGKPPRAFLVLGMHRGGTSATAGLLHQAGASAGRELVGPSASNQAGYFEARPVLRIMEGLLAAAGSFWNDWRALDLGAADPQAVAVARRDLHAYVAEALADGGDLTIKDPRNARAVAFWRAILDDVGVAAVAVLPVRRPGAVARSLQARNGMDRDTAVLLWLRHMLDAERGSRGMTRVFIDYDRMVTDPGEALARIEQASGAVFEAEGAARAVAHLDPSLRHHHGQGAAGCDSSLAEMAEAAYAILQRWAGDETRPDDLSRLDRLEAELEAMIAPFAAGFGAAERARLTLARRIAKLERRSAQRAPVRPTPKGARPNPEGLGYLAEMLSRVGEYAAAEVLIERGLALAPDDLTLRFRQAQIAFRAGRLEEARHAIALCLALEPEFAEYCDLAKKIEAAGPQ